MTVSAKICGLGTEETVTAALAGGAGAVGFVFYPPSPRHVSPEDAAVLAGGAGAARRVGLFVDPDDRWLEGVLAQVPLEMIQLHGAETPARVGEIGARSGLPVMKAIKVRTPEDIAASTAYDGAADWLLFDARPSGGEGRGLPGGNGVAFDWRLLQDHRPAQPWMLSGGLDADNVAAAARVSGATWVDVSSGVESEPGHKQAALITRFLSTVNSI